MRVVAILGGLGSQMMKFSFYLQLKQNYPNAKCMIDTIPYQVHNMWNGYELENIFNIKEPDLKDVLENKCIEGDATNYAKYAMDIIMQINHSKLVIYFNRGYCITYGKSLWLKKILEYFNYYKMILCEKHGFRKEIGDKYKEGNLKKQLPMYFGEFQHNSDKYFPNKETLKEVFEFPIFEDEQNLKYCRKMQMEESVSVHVRRSDHLYDNARLFQTGYYKKAIEYLKSTVADPVFYLFSDDADWCIKHFGELGLEEKDKVVVVNWNNKRESFRDMQLMTYCKHNILAISSFSWWGYYLGKNQEKIVCAPKKYWLEVENHF